MLKKNPLRRLRRHQQHLHKQLRHCQQLRRQQWYLLLQQPLLPLAALPIEPLRPSPPSM